MSKTDKIIKVQQIGSPIRRQHTQRETLIGLGLNRIGRVRELPAWRRTRERGRAMKLHELADRPGARKNRTRIGRGIGSGTGKTGGRGGKGQTARSGVRIKGFEGGQMPLHRRLPKRGFKNTPFALKLNEVNLGRVQAAIDAGKLEAGATVDAAALVKAGILRRAKDGVRLLGSGEIKAKVAFSVWGASKSAVAAVEKAGGSVALLGPKPEAAEPAAT
jgi:large subunit ribosomal protein L15